MSLRPAGMAGNVVSDVDYLPFGPATLMRFGNGRTLDKTYDANYGIAAIADSAVDGLALDYTLDAVGNVTGLAERLTGGGTAARTVEYDALDRLTGLRDSATTEQGFTYDATGNRTSKTTGSPEAYTYPTTSHRLTQTGATARGYDAAGNTTAIGPTRVFTYDDRGRMNQLTDGGVLTREYGYNARGERVVKRKPTVAGGDITYVYDEAGKLLGEYDEAGARIKEYVWLDDTLVAVLGSHGGSSHQYVLTDHLGTPRAVVHPGTNAILWRWDLTGSAFGDHAAQDDPDGDTVAYTFNLRYPGQYYDAETGLHYNYFRDYDPTTGRYVQSDPIGLSGGVSTYAYVGNSPALYSDPYGLQRATAVGPGRGGNASERRQWRRAFQRGGTGDVPGQPTLNTGAADFISAVEEALGLYEDSVSPREKARLENLLSQLQRDINHATTGRRCTTKVTVCISRRNTNIGPSTIRAFMSVGPMHLPSPVPLEWGDYLVCKDLYINNAVPNGCGAPCR